MKNSVMLGIAIASTLLVGVLLGRWWTQPDAGSSVGPETAERQILYWVAPMDPNYRRDAPGKSPMGMDLVPVYADQIDADPSVVAIDPVVVSNLGVRTAPAARSPLALRIETVGYVAYDEDTLQQVATRVDGWLETLTVKSAGEPVRRGQILFELYSPTLVNAQEEYLATLTSRNAALQDASRARLAALGVPGSEIDRLGETRRVQQRARVFAQRDGIVAHLGVREGGYVTPASQIMAIADLARVWVMAEVFEHQAGWVAAKQRAEVALDSVPGRRWEGVVDYVYPELDPTTRTLQVRLRFANPDQVLRPNMLARVAILRPDSGPVIHIPRQALIRGAAVDRVVVALGNGRFRAVPVEIGIESGGRVEIRRGLRVGDPVVTSGQFLIDSESNIDAALGRFEPGDESRSNEAPSRDGTRHDTMDHGSMNHDAAEHDTMQRPGGADDGLRAPQ